MSKECPKCHKVYDDSWAMCLDDREELVSIPDDPNAPKPEPPPESDEPTESKPEEETPQSDIPESTPPPEPEEPKQPIEPTEPSEPAPIEETPKSDIPEPEPPLIDINIQALSDIIDGMKDIIDSQGVTISQFENRIIVLENEEPQPIDLTVIKDKVSVLEQRWIKLKNAWDNAFVGI